MEFKDYFDELGKEFVGDYEKFLDLIDDCDQFSEEDVKLIYRALHKAKQLHANQIRKSKEPYINHPISVAGLLANNGFDAEVVSAALLHDTVEDTEYTLGECDREFGSRIAALVESVTKIGQDTNAATRDKILERTEKDFNTMIIKCGDRLHNMYTLDVMRRTKQIEISEETKGFYVPVTEILRMENIKKYFQDLCLYFLDEKAYKDIYNASEQIKEMNKETLDNFGFEVKDELSKLGVAVKYNYDLRNIGSIYENNIQNKNGEMVVSFDDLIRIELGLKNDIHCYETLGVVQGIVTPQSERVTDYIAFPQKDGYRSIDIKTAYQDVPISVSIATKEMHRYNDLGIFTRNDNEEVKVYAKKRLNDFRQSLKKSA